LFRERFDCIDGQHRGGYVVTTLACQDVRPFTGSHDQTVPAGTFKGRT
jgi:hypothetical protein